MAEPLSVEGIIALASRREGDWHMCASEGSRGPNSSWGSVGLATPCLSPSSCPSVLKWLVSRCNSSLCMQLGKHGAFPIVLAVRFEWEIHI